MPLQATSGAASYDAFGGGVAAVPNYIEDVFSTWLYRGNGSTQTITNNIDLSTKGGMVWIKSRDNTNGHRLTDTSRGVTKSLESNSTNAEATESTGLTAFNTTGFTIGADADYNANAYNFSSWTFRKQPKFFDIVTYTGNGTAGRTVTHNLGSAPGCMIVKATVNGAFGAGAYPWQVYHRSTAAGMGPTKFMVLNSTAAESTGTDRWNSTDPTSTVFTLGNAPEVNESGVTYVAYLFAHDAGGFGLTGTDNVISCGSFTTDANGQASVTLGYEPQWLLSKNTSAVENWVCVDNMRGLSRTEYKGLRPNLTSGTEFSNTVADALFPTATGFATGNGSPSAFKESNTYIYIAIRRGPMKVPTSGTSVFTSVTKTGATSVGQTNTTNFPVDLSIDEGRATNYGAVFYDRLRGSGPYLNSSSTAAEANQSPTYYIGFDSNTSVFNKNYGALGATYVNWLFQRAPSFFDEVCYTGTGSDVSIAHNLQAVPQLAIIKKRNGTPGWVVGCPLLSNTAYGFLNDPIFFYTSGGNPYFQNTAWSDQYLYLRTDQDVNDSGGAYVAYLFATCTGVSKVGSYTGNGSSQTINCGFTGGARFVMIKATSTTGDWMIADSARGIVSGNDPYLELNNTNAEVTGEDWLDTNSTGFVVNEVSGSNANTNGVTYIYLAIA